MGKRKRMVYPRKIAINLFVGVFNHLIDLHSGREEFSLSWIGNDHKALDLFLEVVLGRKKASRDLLRNGYAACRKHEYEAFPASTWGKIDEIFLKKRVLADLPAPVRNLLKVLRTTSQSDLLKMLAENEKNMTCNTSYSQTWKEVFPVSSKVLKQMEGKFLGEWTIHPSKIFQPDLAKVCRVFPAACVYAETKGNLTYFYERKGSDVAIIVVHLKNALEPAAMDYMRTLLEELFVGHPKLLHKSMATLDSHMTGVGPFWQRHELGGGSKVSFYTHVEKLINVLGNLPSAREFEILADTYAHSHLSELILALFMRKLPMLVTSFFQFSKPYLTCDDYEMSDMECSLGGCGPCAYQLYLTKDFCSEIHKDVDKSKFTLAYCSHPDAASSTRVEFMMAQHGFWFGGENGSLFGFDSSVAYGTPYRNRTYSLKVNFPSESVQLEMQKCTIGCAKVYNWMSKSVQLEERITHIYL